MKIKTFKTKLPIYTERFKIQLLGSRDVEEYMKEIRKPYFTEYLDNRSIEKLSDFEVASRLRGLIQYYSSANSIKYEIRLVIKDLENNMLGGVTLNPNLFNNDIEIGYWVKPEYQNNGIATESLLRITEFIGNVFKEVNTLTLRIQERNIKSLSVAGKCRFKALGYEPGTVGRTVRCVLILK